MKAKDFANHVARLAVFVEATRGDAQLLRAFSKTVAHFGSAQITAAVDDAVTDVGGRRSGSGELGRISELLSSAIPFLKGVSKKAFLDDVTHVSKTLESLKAGDLSDFEACAHSTRAAKSTGARLRTDVVERYVEKLNEAIHDADAFGRLFERLQSDSHVRREEAIEIAMRVSGKIAKSATKKKALSSIEATHVRRVGASERRRYFKNQSAA